MMKWLRHLPNTLTLINLFCGMMGVIAMSNALVITALILMGISLLADVFDGMLARKLGVADGIGVQLDSIADTVSFGVLPGMMIFYMGARYAGEFPNQQFIAVLAGLTVASAGFRLARFNVDTRDKKYFWGLATPAGAMLVAGYLWAQDAGRDFGLGVAEFPLIIVILPLFLIFAFHLPVKLPGLKSPKKVVMIPFLIVIAVVIGLFTIGPISITLGLLAYYLLGVLNLFFKFY